MSCLFSVIIPTTGEKVRFEQIKRAITSIRNASSSSVQIITVVNGNKRDPDVVNWLKKNDDVNVVEVEIGSLPNAHRVGRTMVNTEYFSFLDDDDCYLPNALDKRYKVLSENSDLALVVTNGYSGRDENLTEHYKGIEKIQNNPLEYLFEMNWLHNCNHLMKTSMIKEELFCDYHHYLEWTWLAYKICISGLKVASTDEKTFIYYDTPASASKSENYFNAFPELAKKMLKMKPPLTIEKQIKLKLAAHHHNMAEINLNKGNFAKAIQHHIRSIFSKKGYIYILFSRHFVAKLLSKKPAKD